MVKVRTIPQVYKLGPSHKPRHNDPIYQSCYLCGSQEDIEREHVIPQVFYRPHHLAEPIVLRACKTCNHTKSLDDQYVARIFQLTSRAGSSNQLALDWITRERAKASATRNARSPGMGLINRMRESAFLQDMKTPSGIVLASNVPALKIDGERVHAFLGTVAKGFCTAETGEIFDWNKYQIVVESEQLVSVNHRIGGDKSHPFWIAFHHATYAREWGDLFSFIGSCINDADHPQYVSLWSFIIGRSHAAVVGISPRDSAQKTTASKVQSNRLQKVPR
jgi:hypothetical protein